MKIKIIKVQRLSPLWAVRFGNRSRAQVYNGVGENPLNRSGERSIYLNNKSTKDIVSTSGEIPETDKPYISMTAYM
jgi:hypothetical protein